MQIIPVIAFIYTLFFYRKVLKNHNDESLSSTEKTTIWVLCITGPIINGAILYYAWKNKLPKKANYANKISFIAFGIIFVGYFIIRFLMLTR